MENKKHNSKIVWTIIISFLLVPIIVSVVSTIHVINFFSLSNGFGLALTLAIAFEIGALSALAGLVAMGKINKNVVWFIFLILTGYQMMGNTFYAYDLITQRMISEPDLIKNWAELFGFIEEDPIIIKRIIAILSGAVLPIVSLSFLDLLVDYIRKTFGIEENQTQIAQEDLKQEIKNNDEIKSDEIEDEKLEKITSDGEVDLNEEEDFQKILDEKKKRLDKMKQPNLDLLEILYDNGKIQPGEELPSYNEFISKIEKGKYFQKDINLFLTLCNYLEIFRVSNTQKIAIKTYQEAKEVLSNYLTLQ